MPRHITAEDIDTFAKLSGDHHLLHVDRDFASKTRYGTTIAHGLLTAAAASGLLYQAGVINDTVDALLEVNLRFVAPVFPEDEIRDETRLVESRTTSSGDELQRYESIVTGRGNTPVLFAEWLLLKHVTGMTPPTEMPSENEQT